MGMPSGASPVLAQSARIGAGGLGTADLPFFGAEKTHAK